MNVFVVQRNQIQWTPTKAEKQCEWTRGVEEGWMGRVVHSPKNKSVLLIPRWTIIILGQLQPLTLSNGFHISVIEKLGIGILLQLPPANEEKLKFFLCSWVINISAATRSIIVSGSTDNMF